MNSVYIFLIAVSLLLLAFVPGLASVAGIISLFFTKKRSERFISSLIICIGTTITIGSKQVEGEIGLDIFNYYETYKEILNNGIGSAGAYNFGYEKILGYIFYVIAIVFNELNIYEFIFINILILTFLFAIFVELYSNQNQRFSPGYASMVMWACSSFMLAPQLLRQYYSSIFLIFSVLEIGIIFRFIFVILSINTHLSSMYIIALRYISNLASKKIIIILFSLFLFNFELLFLDFINNNDYVNIIGLKKLNYHFEINANEVKRGDLYFILKVSIPLLIILMQSNLIKSSINWKDSNLNFYVLVVFLSIITSPFNTLELRLFLIVYSFLVGYVILEFITIKPLINITVSLLLAESIYRFLYIESSNGLWTLFPGYSVDPLYYMNYIKI